MYIGIVNVIYFIKSIIYYIGIWNLFLFIIDINGLIIGTKIFKSSIAQVYMSSK